MRSLTATAVSARKKKEAKMSEEHFKLPIVCDADTLRSLIRRKSVRVVDVRKAEDYQREHIPTAVSLPLARVLENDLPEKIVTFQYIGHDNTALLEMTFKQWKELGLETEKQERTFPRARHSLSIKKDIYVDA